MEPAPTHPDPNRLYGGIAGAIVVIGIVVAVVANQTPVARLRAAAAALAPTAAGAPTTWTRPTKSALPANVQSLLEDDWAGTGADVSTEAAAESMVGASAWIGSNQLPGTITVGRPNPQGAVMVTWMLNGRKFQWLLSADGQHATAQNQRSYLALQGVNDP